MTSLACWLGVDQRGASSIYLASDSRISWGTNSSWDYGRKLFASQSQPDILGYCGDVVFPSQVLGQIVESIDSGLIFQNTDVPLVRFSKIARAITASLARYPSRQRQKFSIIYCTRQEQGMNSRFFVSVLHYLPDDKWSEQVPILPSQSDVVIAIGSGEKLIMEWRDRWNRVTGEPTSRAIFSALCDAIATGHDPLSGGPAQLVGIYRKGLAHSFGIVHAGQCYLYGLPFNDRDLAGNIEWRNNLFERCDPRTMSPLVGSQRHARPKPLRKEEGTPDKASSR